MNITSIPENQAYIFTKNFVKIYPTFVTVIEYDTPIRILQSGLELSESTQNHQTKKNTSDIPSSELSQEISLRRTKRVISDITLCNSFEHFVTFTFARDRDDVVLLKRRMSKWLANQKAIHGKFTYLIVPEFHKDGKSIHFHALFKDYKGHLTKTHHKIKGRTVYNVKSYHHGFSTLVKIDDIAKVSSYVRKYITKDMPIFTGKKRYWCSTGLKRPYVMYNYSIRENPFLNFVECYKKDNFTIYHCDVTITSLLSKEGHLWYTIFSRNKSYAKLEQKHELQKLVSHTL